MTGIESAEKEFPRPRWRAIGRVLGVVRRLRAEEFLFTLLFLPSTVITLKANFDLHQTGIHSRKIEGGLLRLAVVVFVALLVPFLHRVKGRMKRGAAREIVLFFRTFLPFVLCSAIYTNLHDTIRYVNPHDIHDKLVAIEGWLFGGQPVVWAERFITPARTDFFSFFYTNFFLLTIIVPVVLWFTGRRREARQAQLGIIICFYTGYIFYILFPAAPPRLYLESLGAFSVDLKGGALTTFQHALVEMMPNHASRAAFPSLHTAVSLVVLTYAWKYTRKLFLPLLLFVIGLLASTIYLRHHYVVDLIAGAALVPWAFWITPHFDRWWRGGRPPYDLGDEEGGGVDIGVTPS